MNYPADLTIASIIFNRRFTEGRPRPPRFDAVPRKRCACVEALGAGTCGACGGKVCA